MEKPIEVKMGDNLVRFSSDGKVFVIDAINLMIPDNESQNVWKMIKKDYPAILALCEPYRTDKGESILIVNTEGLEKILSLLPEYLGASGTYVMAES